MFPRGSDMTIRQLRLNLLPFNHDRREISAPPGTSPIRHSETRPAPLHHHDTTSSLAQSLRDSKRALHAFRLERFFDAETVVAHNLEERDGVVEGEFDAVVCDGVVKVGLVSWETGVTTTG